MKGSFKRDDFNALWLALFIPIFAAYLQPITAFCARAWQNGSITKVSDTN